MEYRRVENSGVLGMWKEDRLVGEIYTVDELWKRRVYLTVSKESGTKRAQREDFPVSVRSKRGII